MVGGAGRVTGGRGRETPRCLLRAAARNAIRKERIPRPASCPRPSTTDLSSRRQTQNGEDLR
jgi:hypothetical protein